MKNKSILDYMSKSSKSHKPFPSSSPSSKEPLIDELREKEPPITPTPLHKESGEESHFVHSQSEEDLVLLPHDPGKRKPIMSYPVNDRDVVIRGFIDKKPCRPRPSRELPKTLQGTKKRSFKLQWYDRYDWLEYSEQNDAAYCFESILNLIALYPTIVEVLEKIGKEAKCSDDRAKAQIAFDHLESFEFIFMLHLMKVIFGYTNDLCQALQRRDQDIVNAMTIVKLTKEILQNTRDHGWDNFIDSVRDFCVKYKIEVPNMNDVYAPPGRSRRFLDKVTNLHRYRVEMFLSVIDLQVQELNDRFDETSMELLICMACLSPVNNFASFEKRKLLRLAEFYPKEFLSVDIMRLDFQLDIFVGDMRSDSRFQNLKGLGEHSMMLVETNKHLAYPLVYLLLKLVLILPVATASVERVFSSMTFVKNKLRNKLGDKLLNHCLVTFIERDFFLQVSDDDIINRYQNMKSRRIVLD